MFILIELTFYVLTAQLLALQYLKNRYNYGLTLIEI